MKSRWSWNSLKIFTAKFKEIVWTLSRKLRCPLDLGTNYSGKGESSTNTKLPYIALVGSLLYLSARTRSHIAVLCSIIGQHCEHISYIFVRGIEKMLQYLKRTQDFGYHLEPGNSTQISAYIDTSFACQKGVARRSRNGWAVFYGNVLIIYKSILQRCVATKRAVKEYVSQSEACHTVRWLRDPLK